MKNKEKQTREELKNQEPSGSLSEAELDNIAGGGGPAVAAPLVALRQGTNPVAKAGATAAPISAPARKHP